MTSHTIIEEDPRPATSWQLEGQGRVVDRRAMLHRLASIMRRRYESYPKASASLVNLPEVVRKLELLLFSRAGSYDEYSNVHTLKRRLQYVISCVFQHAKQKKRSCRKRMTIRSAAGPEQQPKKLNTERRSIAMFMLQNDFYMLNHLFEFVSTKDTIACCLVNRAAATILPHTVQDLSVSLDQLSKLRLARFPHLRVFEVTPGGEEGSPPQCHNTTSEDSDGRALLLQDVCNELSAGMCPNLRSLRLGQTFAHSSSVLPHLVKALAKCPHLVHLALGGNRLGDQDIVELAKGLRYCHALEHLDLRANYIGERGCAALCSLVLPNVPRLVELSWGGNILNDGCAEMIAQALESGTCTNILFLGLEHNFIQVEGVKRIVDMYGQRQCPKLNYVACYGNAAGTNVMDVEYLEKELLSP